MARLSNTPILFGGQSVGASQAILGDTKAANLAGTSVTWGTGAGSDPEPRTEHAMAATGLLLPTVTMFGGLKKVPGGSQIVTDETFTYTGGGWERVQDVPSSWPAARTGHAMAAANGKVYMFGGQSAAAVPLNDLWEFDPSWTSASGGSPWTQLSPSNSPQARYGHSMAYNSIAGRIFMFGGLAQGGTWSFDPATGSSPAWTQHTQLPQPPLRIYASMAYASIFSQVVLFGGADSFFQPLDDTWTLDNAGNWTQRTPATPTSPWPAARHGHAMASGIGPNQAVMVGGTDVPLFSPTNGEPLESTWIWNGVAWLETLQPPESRTGVAMAYDSANDQHVMFGGRSEATTMLVGDTWELEGVNWHDRTSIGVPAPSSREGAGMCFDSARNLTVLYGGDDGAPLGDTWEWDGTNWNQRTFGPGPTPPPIAGVPLVFDSTRNVSWLLAGQELWSYDGLTWVKFERPVARWAAAVCFDPVRNRLVMFDGREKPLAGAQNQELWERNNATGQWYQVTSQPGLPSARQDAGMVFDSRPGYQKCLMVAGHQQNSFYSDTHTWDGTTWSSPTYFPPGTGSRTHHGLVFDVSQGRAVMFGGFSGSCTLGTEMNREGTHEWDGASWQQTTQPTDPHPGATFFVTMAYDPTSQRTVLFGGENPPDPMPSCSSTLSNETWEYDGATDTWTQLFPPVSPSARRGHHMVSDPATGKVLLFGGNLAPGPGNLSDDETWLWDGLTKTWEQQFPANNPPAREQGFAVNTGSHVLMGFGGGGSYHSDLWQWDGQNWACIDPGNPGGGSSTLPPTRTNYGMAYDSLRDRLVLFGGLSSATGMPLDDTWEWDISCGVWTQVAQGPGATPAPREGGRLSYDEARQRIVLYGGTNGVATFPNTWEWDGNSWLLRSPSNAPPPSSDFGFTYDSTRQVSVAFGKLGTWDYGPVSPPQVESFPSSCASGAPILTVNSLGGPWLGESVRLDIAGEPLSNIGAMIFGFSMPSPVPLTLLGFNGSPGCALNIAPDILDVQLQMKGTYVSAPLPATSSLVGYELFAQTAFFDLLQIGAPVSTSNVLRMALGEK